jgi:hypothetical protein
MIRYKPLWLYTVLSFGERARGITSSKLPLKPLAGTFEGAQILDFWIVFYKACIFFGKADCVWGGGAGEHP